jgi:hypothetical protein
VLPQRGVGEAVAAVVGEGRVAHAERVQLAEHGGRVADLVQALDGERGDEAAVAVVVMVRMVREGGGRVVGRR